MRENRGNKMKKALPARRMFAQVIDSVILHSIVYYYSTYTAGSWVALYVKAIIPFIVIQSLFWHKGTTIGKISMGLYVWDLEKDKTLSWGKMIIRECIGKLISTITLGAGFIMIFIDKNDRGFHDRLVASLVVEKDKNISQKSLEDKITDLVG